MYFFNKIKKYIFSPIKIAFMVAFILHIVFLNGVSREVLLSKSDVEKVKESPGEYESFAQKGDKIYSYQISAERWS